MKNKYKNYDIVMKYAKSIKEERQTLGEWWFKQEYLCEFVETEDQLFTYDQVQNILLRVMPHPIPERIDYTRMELPGEMALPLLIGYSRAGVIIEDLALFPHLCVAGETFGGKSTFLRQALVTLKLERPETEIYIIDMKRLEFSFFGSYSWYAYTMQEAIRMLEHLYKELHRRLKLLDKAGCVNIQEYHQQGYELPYCVLALDEFSQWTKTWWAKAYRNDGPFRFPPVVVVCKGLKRKPGSLLALLMRSV